MLQKEAGSSAEKDKCTLCWSAREWKRSRSVHVAWEGSLWSNCKAALTAGLPLLAFHFSSSSYLSAIICKTSTGVRGEIKLYKAPLPNSFKVWAARTNIAALSLLLIIKCRHFVQPYRTWHRGHTFWVLFGVDVFLLKLSFKFCHTRYQPSYGQRRSDRVFSLRAWAMHLLVLTTTAMLLVTNVEFT